MQKVLLWRTQTTFNLTNKTLLETACITIIWWLSYNLTPTHHFNMGQAQTGRNRSNNRSAETTHSRKLRSQRWSARLLLLKYGHLSIASNAQKLSEITTCLGQTRLVTGERARTRMLAVLLNSRGVCNQHLNNIAAGLQDYDEALKLHSDYAMVLYNQAIGIWRNKCYYRQWMTTRQLCEWIQIMKPAYYNRSICYSSIGKMVHATRDAIVATNLLPENYPKSQSLKRFLHREAKDPLFQWERVSYYWCTYFAHNLWHCSRQIFSLRILIPIPDWMKRRVIM